MIRRIKASEFKNMLWKNGKGTTTQIFREPETGDFDWRVSCATVANDGPFSHFIGYDRSLSIINGNGMVVSVNDKPGITITPVTPPFSFSGDHNTSAILIDGPVLDFNVIYRRDKIVSHVQRVVMQGTDRYLTSVRRGDELLLYPYVGALHLSTSTQRMDTTEGDCYVINGHGVVQLSTPPDPSPCSVFVVRVCRKE